MSTRSIIAAAALAAGALLASQANAVTIWAPDNLGTTNTGSVGDRIIRFDSSNPAGTVVTVGATGVANEGLSGMDFDSTGTLYAASGFNSTGGTFAGSKLYRINTTTGAATLVGAMGLPTGDAVTDLSWNPVTNTMQAISYNGSVNNFYTVNRTTGAATLVGTVTGGGAGALDIGLATNHLGVNYIHDLVADRMYVLAGTVAAALPNTTGIDSNFSQGMTMNWSGAGGDTQDRWYLGALTSSLVGEVMTVNNTTGSATVISPGGVWPTHSNGLPEYETGDLAIAPGVPEPATAGLLALGALAMIRRRRA
jgi:hypothetical protein